MSARRISHSGASWGATAGNPQPVAPGMTIAAFLSEWGEAIANAVSKLHKPLYTFDLGNAEAVFSKFPRKLFAIQKHVSCALTQRLKTHKEAFLIGEMGVGKTSMAVGTAALLRAPRVLVLCPPHLCDKWRREIGYIMPHAPVCIVKGMVDLDERISYVDHINAVSAFFVLGREKAKLGSEWRHCATHKNIFVPAEEDQETGENGTAATRRDSLVCPACGTEILDSDGFPYASLEAFGPKKLQCQGERKVWRDGGWRRVVCGEPLWQTIRLQDGAGKARFPLAEYISKRYAKYFDLLIIDEAHQYKAAGSAQGFAMATLSDCCQKVLALTGTIFGGKATSIFPLLYRLASDVRNAFGYNAERAWAARYGILERVFKKDGDSLSDGRVSNAKNYKVQVRECPGATPDIITWLLGRAAFVRLSDIESALPPFTEPVQSVSMDMDVFKAYNELSAELKSVMQQLLREKKTNLLGTYLQTLLTYPDAPFRQVDVRDPKSGLTLVTAPCFSEDRVYPKEKALIDICLREKGRGRRVLVYCTHTNRRDITERLAAGLTKEGLRVTRLSASVSAAVREAWIDKQVASGVDVMIANPRLVETGLDLIAFPTFVFFEVDFSAYTMAQAARRSWRIGQKDPVFVHYLYSSGTLQARAVSLIAAKIRAARMVDGDLLYEGGLAQQASGQEPLLVELARNLVANAKISEDLTSIFANIRLSDDTAIGGFSIPAEEPQGAAVEDTVISLPVAAVSPGQTNEFLPAEYLAGVSGGETAISVLPTPQPAAAAPLGSGTGASVQLELGL